MPDQKSRKRIQIPKQVTINFSTTTIFKVILIGLVLWFLWFVKEIVVMLFVAVLLAALIEPAATWLHKRKISRGFAVLGIYVVMASVLSVLLVLIIPPFADQFELLIENFAIMFENASVWLNQVYTFGEQFGLSADQIRSGIQSIFEGEDGLVSGIFGTVTNAVVGLVSLIVILVLAFYIVVEEDAWRRFFRRAAPTEYQPYLTQMFSRMQDKLGEWLRGQILLMVIVGVLFYIGLLILQVPSALVLGIFAGFMEIIPYAGPAIAIIPAFFIALSVSPVKAVLVLLLFIVIQQVENNILTPKIMQKVAGLNPVVSIVALLIGWKMAGIPGAILAIPLATAASVFIYDVLRKPEDV